MQPDPAQILFRDYRPADRGWVMAANVRHYTEVEGFDASFAQAVSGALDLLEAGREDASTFLIVETGKDAPPVGCVFFSPEAPRTGRLRLFYLDAAFRGRGIGRDMIERTLDHARTHGIDRVRVSTFDRHQAACGLYRNLGFREQVRAPTTAFGQHMHQIDFEIALHDLSP